LSQKQTHFKNINYRSLKEGDHIGSPLQKQTSIPVAELVEAEQHVRGHFDKLNVRYW
jgi:hypothetical protein